MEWRMVLGDLSALQWTGTVIAAVLVGLSKAGFGSGAGILAVPLMAAVLGPANMLPAMLLVLISGDVFSLLHHKREHERRVLAMLVPGLVVGVGAGFLALDWFLALPASEAWMKRVIGGISIAFVGIQCWRSAQERRLGAAAVPYRPKVWQGMALGAVAGVTSTLAHAGGPLIALFLLPQKLPKKAFVGTMIKYFFIGNLIKLVPYFASGIMTRQSGLLALILVPAVAVGALAGIYLQSKCSDRAFRLTVYVLALLAGAYLLVGSWGGHPDGPPEQPAAVNPRDAFRDGLAAFHGGKWEAAEEAFRRAAGQPGPRTDAARFNLALALYRGARLDEAAEVFRPLADSPEQVVAASAGLNAGNCAYRAERWERAAGWYARCLGVCAGRAGGPGGEGAMGEALQEIQARARFNLAAARRRMSRPPAPGAGSGAGATTAERTAEGPAADAGAEGEYQEIAGPATGHASGTGEGMRDLAGVLAGLKARDTGPVLSTGRGVAVLGGRAW